MTDTPNWNQLASAFDTIDDTDMAIETYTSLPDEREDKGLLYLVIYGVLQAIYVQQDAVEALVRGFWPQRSPQYKIEHEPEAASIRSIRNKTVGHPTKDGDVKSRMKPGVQTSYHIIQNTMSTSGFQVMTTHADASWTFESVNLRDLIDKNARMLERVLEKLKQELEDIEMDHREQFRGTKLANLFPHTLDYYLELIVKGARNPVPGHSHLAVGACQEIAGSVQRLRLALTERGQLEPHDHELKEVEYPLAELAAYFEQRGSLKDPRAAYIFAVFLREKVHALRTTAREIDEDYAQDLPKS